MAHFALPNSPLYMGMGHFALPTSPLYMGMGTRCTAKRPRICGHGDTLHSQKDPYMAPYTPCKVPKTLEMGNFRGHTVRVRKVGCFLPPVATGPGVLNSAPYSPCWYTRDFWF